MYRSLHIWEPLFFHLPSNHLHELTHAHTENVCVWCARAKSTYYLFLTKPTMKLSELSTAHNNRPQSFIIFSGLRSNTHTKSEKKKNVFFFLIHRFSELFDAIFFFFITIKLCSIVITIAICYTQP